jgi:hypothetical protein
MLKTYRIIPLVFILFLFGFTLSTVAPVFAQQTLEDRINSLEDTLCALHPEVKTHVVRDAHTADPVGIFCQGRGMEKLDKAPPPPKKFFCAQFPEALNYQECTQKIKAKRCREDPDYAHQCW